MSRSRPRIVLQARMNSARLPGKVLLPICGMPIVVLAAMRAARNGVDTVVAISSDDVDNQLAEALRTHRLQHVRGPMEDVLARFVAATRDLDDNDICIRLTSDNVFPDGEFVQRLIDAVEHGASGYAGFSGGTEGLPYGLSGEAMYVRLLRQADRNARDSQDREHVTPWVIRQCGRQAPPMPRVDRMDLAHLRCTIDTLDDYRAVRSALAGVASPVTEPWSDFCRRLARWSERAKPAVPARIVAGELQGSMVLGGAQFGSDYGIANRTGKPDDDELRAIIEIAECAGISHVDTAAGYGDSEARLGATLTLESPLSVVTKLPPDLLSGHEPNDSLDRRIRITVDRSLSHLKRSRLDALLLHRFVHYQEARDEIFHVLRSLKQDGMIGRIGVSVYSPAELVTLLQDPDIGLIQLPFNILDRRWLDPAVQRAIIGRPDVILHGRSALLQGLLTIDDPAGWPIADAALAEACIHALDSLVRELGRTDTADLCFAYARAQPWLAGIVVGADTANQLTKNIALFRKPSLTTDQQQLITARLPREFPEQLLNPAHWRRL